MFFSHMFWVGIAGRTSSDAFLQAKALNASLRSSSVDRWDARTKAQDDLYNFGTMPGQVLNILRSDWTLRCRHKGVSHYGFSVLSEEITDYVHYEAKCPDALRFMEVDRFVPQLLTPNEYREWYFIFYYDMRPLVKTEAQMSLCTTVFVCVVLCVASIFFSNDANVLVLKPVEQMITRVEAIRDDPLVAMKMADDEFKREEYKKKMAEKKTQRQKMQEKLLCRREENQNAMETVILEKTIIKLGSLLALGFGEAGANIVSANMRGNAAGISAMIEGSNVECIVGSARIRNFSVATEVLQGKVMTFVNQIAEIVHGVVDECRGAVNKNNGDTFLIIWRTAGMSPEEVLKVAEMSVYAFATILGAVNRSQVLANYRTHPGLQQRLKGDCRVDLCFGLHWGWAIEGAIGSEFKIDASYISPNVSVAFSVEAATRTYGVSILASQSVVELCSKRMAKHLRLIDKVKIKGCSKALQLYCLDLDYPSIQVDGHGALPIVWNNQYRFKSRQQLEIRKSELWLEVPSIAELLESDQDFRTMRRIYTDPWRQTFNMGYQNYSQGEWQVARTLLMKTQTLLSEQDGPSCALLRFMESYQFDAPKDWKGVHPLL
eukprot:TRINITY_DN16115_c1_g1_i1.p1 TRINITY_DN16115_c1_g1~~TRINITY_DN16115_c1_g1_i1.p1  ORF type:complete len:618 (+),score=84.65 TRINITY_DN16115_c1_g1_i1:48-1856(+)